MKGPNPENEHCSIQRISISLVTSTAPCPRLKKLNPPQNMTSLLPDSMTSLNSSNECTSTQLLSAEIVRNKHLFEIVSSGEGLVVGLVVGVRVGVATVASEGFIVGANVGAAVSLLEGSLVGTCVVAVVVGVDVGTFVGSTVGLDVVGKNVGERDGGVVIFIVGF